MENVPSHVTLKDIFDYIDQADIYEIQNLMRVIQDSLITHYPDWDFVYCATHKDPVKRVQELENALRLAKLCLKEQTGQ